jgi:hypothetical protein
MRHVASSLALIPLSFWACGSDDSDELGSTAGGDERQCGLSDGR